jgi:hypothetical protein
MIAVQACLAGLTIIAVTLFPASAPADVLELITEQEANYQDAPNRLGPTRGPTPGPIIEVMSPHSDAKETVPFRLAVRFRTYPGGKPIDKESVRLIYMKENPIELTKRVYDFITRTGIEVNEVKAPRGRHTIQIILRDTDRRTATPYYLTFEVM